MQNAFLYLLKEEILGCSWVCKRFTVVKIILEMCLKLDPSIVNVEKLLNLLEKSYDVHTANVLPFFNITHKRVRQYWSKLSSEAVVCRCCLK